MLGIEFGCSAYFCVHVCLSGISVLLYNRFLCGLLCSVVQFKHVLERTLTMKAQISIIFPVPLIYLVRVDGSRLRGNLQPGHLRP